MSWSQTMVVMWIQFVVAAAMLLSVARLALARVLQPVDRIRMIQCTLVAVLAVPAFMTLAPWRLRLLSPVIGSVTESSSDTALHPGVRGPFSETNLTPGEIEVSNPPWNSPIPPVGSNSAQDTSIARAEKLSGVAAASNSRGFLPGFFNVWMVSAVTIAILHGIAFCWFLLEWGSGALRLRHLIHASSPAPQRVHDVWQTITNGQSARVKLLVSSAIESPLTFGWWHPIVILPRETAATNGPSLGYCLAHEWSHIERADILSWHGLFACQILLWYQPLFWTLRRELRICQDLLADDRSVPGEHDAIEYSELLVSFAKKRLTGPLVGALTFLDHPSQLMRRVKMLLQRQVAVRTQCTWKFSLAALLLALLSAGAISAFRIDMARAQEASQKIANSSAAKSENAGQTDGAKDESAPAKDQGASKDKSAVPKDKPAEPPVRLSYTGIVLEKGTGKGIPNATVVVRRSNLTPQQYQIIEETKHTTDADGKYSFEIPPEQVAMRYLYIELDVDHENYAARKGFGYALSMIRKNEGLGERPFFERVELHAAEPTTGTLLSPDGKPLSGVMIQGYSKANPGDFGEYGSFTQAITTVEGKFRLNLIKGGEGVFWILPKDYAIAQKLAGKQRGDLGEFRVQPGIRVTGRVLSVEGKPAPGVAVNITSQNHEDLQGLNVMSSVRRGAISDEEGRFAFDPLPAGNYRVVPEEHLSDPLVRDRTIYPVPGVFLPQKVMLKEGATVAPLEIQAVPHVVFHAQYLDASGKKTTGHELFLFGQIDGDHWFGKGRPDAQGTIALQVPHGLQKVQVQLMTNEHGALRYRLGPGKPLQNEQRNIQFGTLNDDVEGFEIVRYRAPIMLIKAMDEEGRLIKGFQVSATYPWGKQEYVLEGERRSDVSFERQDDGRYRTSQMLPDEEVTFTAAAAGYQPVSEKRKLAEGESQELILTLKKAAEKKQE